VIAISEDTAHSLKDDYGIPEHRITVIHCGFDLTPWISVDRDAREKCSCVFVGRPDVRKGWDILETAWPIVRAKIPSALLSVVGWNEAPHDGIFFRGRLNDADLQHLIGTARMVVCPSRLEGFGLTAAESIASGTPVVASNVGGLKRVVVHGETGILVDPNPQSVADAIIHLLSHDIAWNALHQGCRSSRMRFDASPEIRAHLALFSALYS
jgi:glycosyltransferase involved in cell wall biosynthesis